MTSLREALIRARGNREEEKLINPLDKFRETQEMDKKIQAEIADRKKHETEWQVDRECE